MKLNPPFGEVGAEKGYDVILDGSLTRSSWDAWNQNGRKYRAFVNIEIIARAG